MEKKQDKTTAQTFASLLVLMINNDTDNIELTFNFNKCKAKFKVELLDLQDTTHQHEDKGE